jgi:hypothetical protein
MLEPVEQNSFSTASSWRMWPTSPSAPNDARPERLRRNERPATTSFSTLPKSPPSTTEVYRISGVVVRDRVMLNWT